MSMKSSRFLLFLVIFVTLISVVINLAQPFSIKISSFQSKFPGVNLKFIPGITDKSFAIRRGLDLEGGTSITLKAEMKDIPEAQRPAALDSAKAVIDLVEICPIPQKFRFIFGYIFISLSHSNMISNSLTCLKESFSFI